MALRQFTEDVYVTYVQRLRVQ